MREGESLRRRVRAEIRQHGHADHCRQLKPVVSPWSRQVIGMILAITGRVGVENDATTLHKYLDLTTQGAFGKSLGTS